MDSLVFDESRDNGVRDNLYQCTIFYPQQFFAHQTNVWNVIIKFAIDKSPRMYSFSIK